MKGKLSNPGIQQRERTLCSGNGGNLSPLASAMPRREGGLWTVARTTGLKSPCHCPEKCPRHMAGTTHRLGVTGQQRKPAFCPGWRAPLPGLCPFCVVFDAPENGRSPKWPLLSFLTTQVGMTKLEIVGSAQHSSVTLLVAQELWSNPYLSGL